MYVEGYSLMLVCLSVYQTIKGQHPLTYDELDGIKTVWATRPLTNGEP